jgi:hypothetical protein
MTNMCFNWMKITGTISEITRFKQTCIRTVSENKRAQLDFSAIVPPEEQKWNPIDFDVTVDAPGCYEFRFDTRSGGPLLVWKNMAKMFPALEFSLSGVDEQCEWAFEGTIQGGKLELWDAPVIFTITDPKTGETISGPRAQMEPFLGKEGGVISVRAGKANEIDGERQ